MWFCCGLAFETPMDQSLRFNLEPGTCWICHTTLAQRDEVFRVNPNLMQVVTVLMVRHWRFDQKNWWWIWKLRIQEKTKSNCACAIANDFEPCCLPLLVGYDNQAELIQIVCIYLHDSGQLLQTSWTDVMSCFGHS